MLVRFFELGLIAFLLSVAPARGDESPVADDDIPLVGRPADLPFSGASGQFEVEARAEPGTLRADETMTFIVSIRATGPIRREPRRLDLRQLQAFADRFYIEDPEERQRRPDARTREFVYSLKPRRAEVNEVPSVPFVYFNPTIRPASKGFQICFTDAIPLKILPAEEYAPLPSLPKEFYIVRSGPELLKRETTPEPAGPAKLAFFLAGPPLLCAGWYHAWRTFYPDTVRQIRRRRSAAAKRSLKMLRAARRFSPQLRAIRAAESVTSFLHERFELAAVDPTPCEASDALQRAGCDVTLRDRAARFFKACDAFRYAPDIDGVDSVAADATQLILDLEAETWASDCS